MASEEQWIDRARAGDSASFEQLYRLHVGRTYALCLRLTGDPVRAQELTQDAFVRAWEKLGQFRGDSLFSSWLHRLTVNVVLGAGRSLSRRAAKEQPMGDAATWEELFPAPGSGAGSVPDLDLERAIAALPERARTVFVLHDVEGYPHAEIARRLEMAVGTSKVHLHRARKQLRKALRG